MRIIDKAYLYCKVILLYFFSFLTVLVMMLKQQGLQWVCGDELLKWTIGFLGQLLWAGEHVIARPRENFFRKTKFL